MECMQTKFGGHSLSGCGDLAPFAFLRKWPNFPFKAFMDYGGQKIESAQKIQRLMRYMCASSLVGLASQITFAFNFCNNASNAKFVLTNFA